MKLKVKDSGGVIGEAAVDTLSKLGRGASAVIHQANFQGQKYAAKIYHNGHPTDVDKIFAMLANAPANVRIKVAGADHPQLAWPEGVLFDNSNQFVGYIMPLVDLKRAYSLEYFYDHNLIKKLESPSESALSFKLEIARNLALLVADLHDHGHHFIDLKPQNIRVLLGSHVVTLVDCDGFSIAGPDGRRYPAEMVSSDYVAPEVYRASLSPRTLGEEQDRYALAVILFQLLNKGTHPFQGILAPNINGASTNDEKASLGLYPHGLKSDQRIKPRKHSIHFLLDDRIRGLFDSSFIGDPGDRPSARQWASCLDTILRDKGLSRCDKHPYDLTHMRFSGKECPTCYLSQLPAVRVAASHTSILTPSASGTNSAHSSQGTQQVSVNLQTAAHPNRSLGRLIGAVIMIIILYALYSNTLSPTSAVTQGSSPYDPPMYSDAELCTAYWRPDVDKTEVLRQIAKRGYKSYDEMCPQSATANSTSPDGSESSKASSQQGGTGDLAQILGNLYAGAQSDEVDGNNAINEEQYAAAIKMITEAGRNFPGVASGNQVDPVVVYHDLDISPFGAVRIMACKQSFSDTGFCYRQGSDLICDGEYFSLLMKYSDRACVKSLLK